MAENNDLIRSKSIRQTFNKFFRPKIIQNQIALTLEVQNAERCLTHRLPTEIMLKIVEMLQGADFLVLMYTCRWFNTLLKDIKPTLSPSTNDRYLLNERLKDDSFSALAATEKWSPEKKTLLCRPCRSSHDTAAFAPEHRQQACGMERQCLGSYGKVKICPHNFLTRVELRERVAKDHVIACKEPSPGNPELSCGPHEFAISWEYSKILYRDPSLEHGQTVSWDTVESRLIEANRYLCPHMHSTDKSLHQRLRNNRREEKVVEEWPLPKADPKSPIFSNADKRSFAEVECKNRHCFTKLQVWRYVFPLTVSEWYVRLERDFGTLEFNNDPLWCAQLEWS